MQFQFHYGSVKSIKQLLEHVKGVLFQFHYGSVKRQQAVVTPFNLIIFQFHYGSVKRLIVSSVAPFKLHFNSTMVRLKAGFDTDLLDGYHAFQFHYGSVKRDLAKFYGYAVGEFQFHYGSVKSKPWGVW